jgi:hypothetical protein
MTCVPSTNPARKARNPGRPRRIGPPPKRYVPSVSHRTSGDRADPSNAWLTVYSGRERLGAYRRLADRWVALDRQHRRLGEFRTEEEALAAIARSVPR